MPSKYLYLSAIVLLCTVWNAIGFHQGDEHFQILEFAIHRAGVEGAELAWEYHEQMRPGLQPYLAYCLYRVLGLFGEVDPFFMAGLLRFFSAALFLGVAVTVYNRYRSAFPGKSALRWFALLLLFSWCNVYAGVRFASESWSGACFAFGLLLYPLPELGDPEMKSSVITRSLFWRGRRCGGGAGHTPPRNLMSKAFLAGGLFGLSFEFRYQLAIAVVGFILWLLIATKVNWKHLAATVAGGLLAVGIGTLTDAWLYDEWVFAPWKYLEQNLIQGKAATFGTKPWYGYVEYIFERGVPPLSLVYLAAIGYFCYRYRWDPVTWSFLLFFVVHSILSRKDIRFLFPMLPFLPLAVAVLYRDLRLRYGKDFLRRGWRRMAFRTLIVISCVLLAWVMIRPMNSNLPATRFVYNNYQEPVTLLANGKSIYNHSGLVHRFYRREGLTIVNSGDGQPLARPCPTATCLYSVETNDPNPPEGAKLVYTRAPFFLNSFDAWGLLRNPRYWYVYEVD